MSPFDVEGGACPPQRAAGKCIVLASGRAQKAEMKIERAAAHQREELRLAELHRKHIVRQVRGRIAQGRDAPYAVELTRVKCLLTMAVNDSQSHSTHCCTF